MQRERVHRPCTALVTTRPHSAPTADSPMSGLASHRVMAVAAMWSGQYRLASLSRIRGDFSICTGTPGNGLKIAGHRTRLKSPPMDPHCRGLGIVTCASLKVAVGPMGLHG